MNPHSSIHMCCRVLLACVMVGLLHGTLVSSVFAAPTKRPAVVKPRNPAQVRDQEQVWPRLKTLADRVTPDLARRLGVGKGVVGPQTVVRGDLMWTARDNMGDVFWTEAKVYCDTCQAGGYGDWRMATLSELHSLYAAGNRYETWGGEYFGDGSRVTNCVSIARPFFITDIFVWSATLELYGDATMAYLYSYSCSDSDYDVTMWDPKAFSILDPITGPYASPFGKRVLCVRRSGE